MRVSETSRTHGESSCDHDRDKNQRNKQRRQIMFGRPSSDQQKFKIKYIYNESASRRTKNPAITKPGLRFINF